MELKVKGKLKRITISTLLSFLLFSSLSLALSCDYNGTGTELFSVYRANNTHIGTPGYYATNFTCDVTSATIRDAGTCGANEQSWFSLWRENNTHIGVVGYYQNKSMCVESKYDCYVNATGSCKSGETAVFSVYKENNTHIGVVGYYGNVMCCKAVSGVQEYSRSVSQQAVAGVSSTLKGEMKRGASSSLSTSALTEKFLGRVKSLNQQFSLDTFSRRVSNIFRSGMEGTSILTGTSSLKTLLQKLSESVGLNAVTTRTSNIFRKASNPLSLSEQFTTFTGRVKNLGQAVGIDSISRRLTDIFRTEGQQSSLGEGVSSFSTRVKSLGQKVSVNTATERAVSILRNLRQPIDLYEEITKDTTLPAYIKKTIMEHIGIDSTVGRRTSIFRTGKEEISLISKIKANFEFLKQIMPKEKDLLKFMSVFRIGFDDDKNVLNKWLGLGI